MSKLSDSVMDDFTSRGTGLEWDFLERIYSDWYADGNILFVMGDGVEFDNAEEAQLAEAAKHIPHLVLEIERLEEELVIQKIIVENLANNLRQQKAPD